jgi:hypothetical protein
MNMPLVPVTVDGPAIMPGKNTFLPGNMLPDCVGEKGIKISL